MRSICTCVAVALMVGTPENVRAEESVELGLGVDYLGEAFSFNAQNHIVLVPLSVSYRTDSMRVALVVPYVSEEASNSDPSRLSKHGGWGDTTLSVSNTFTLGQGTWLDITGAVKLPTTSSSVSLGTGQPDFVVQSELFKRTPGGLLVSMRLGHRISGSSSSLKLANMWNAGAGIYRSRGDETVGLHLDWRQSAFAYQPNGVDVSVAYSRKLGKRFNLQGYTFIALKGSQPGAGGGTRIVFRFP